MGWWRWREYHRFSSDLHVSCRSFVHTYSVTNRPRQCVNTPGHGNH
ncbi:hypothetical protein ACFFX0_23980 [Citricoccus parietis]|uniref:Uncharacterized protein n=1 Tax=Citricoccus parietis TaxID=592307 RepID=A0ABV5G569_9MICC